MVPDDPWMPNCLPKTEGSWQLSPFVLSLSLAPGAAAIKMESTIDQQTPSSVEGDDSIRSLQQSSGQFDLPEDLANATAAIVQAAAMNRRSDSYFSETDADEDEFEEEEESREFSTRETASVTDLGETGNFTSPTNSMTMATTNRRNNSVQIITEEINDSSASLPTATEGILQSCGACLLTVQELSDLWRRSEGELVTALQHKTRSGFSLSPFSFAGRPTARRPDEDVLLLHSVFATFCSPAPTLKEVGAIYQKEQELWEKSGGDVSNMRRRRRPQKQEGGATVPWDPLISVSIKQKAPVVRLLSNDPARHILRLPVPFQLAFFRILIRLLTNETDLQYDEECLFTLKWLLQDETEANRRQSLRDSLTFKRMGSNMSEDSKISVSELQNRTHERVNRLRRKRQSLEKHRKDQGWILERMTSSTQLATSRRPSQLYTIVRFRSGWPNSAVCVLLELLELVRHSHPHLCGPVTRLLGLLGTAGIAVGELRRMFALAEEPVTKDSVVEKLLLVRALSTAAEGASQSTLLVGKASPKYFFSFGRGNGLSRTIKSLPSWPFRNDFGMSLWFRGESFDGITADKYPVLLSLRAPDGGGIEISLMPLDENSKATVIAVSTYDSGTEEGGDPAQVNRVMLKGCVLLPRVWYHLAVRHTRFRLKGVFSLAARQQVTIMLDGKVMATEPLKFPNVSFVESGPATTTSNLLSALRKNYSTSMNITFAADFAGQTGALYVFHDNVSDATLRALYEVTAGTSRLKRKETIVDRQWHSHAKQTTSVVEIATADADEIVVSNKDGKPTSFLESTKASVVDLGEGVDDEIDFPLELTKSHLRAKLFIVWDPKRTEADTVLDLHSGAHVTMDLDSVRPWSVDGAKDVIASVGGVQALLPTFHSLLSGGVEKTWKQSKQTLTNEGVISEEDVASSVIPSLMFLLASFLRDHDENAREMLRCGGIDIVEQLLMSNKTPTVQDSGSESLMSAVRQNRPTAELLLDSLLDLKSACSRYDVLETLVFKRLLFNLQLWFGEGNCGSGVALYPTLLPVLAALASSNPEKVRDCVGVRQMLELAREFTDVSSSPEEMANYLQEAATDLFDRGKLSDLPPYAPVTMQERRHIVDILFGMVANVMVSGTTAEELSPLLNFIADNADYEWEQASLQSSKGRDPNSRVGSRQERYLATVRAVSILFYLLHGRPHDPNLVSTFVTHCGGPQGAASWILCCLVNSFDDEIRSYGVRCLVDFLEVAVPTGDSTTAGDKKESAREALPGSTNANSSRVSHTAKRLSETITNVSKGLVAIGTGQGLTTILPPSKPVTIDVVYKLLWHLLKCHRIRIGKKTHASLVYLLLEDRGIQFDCKSRLKDLVISDEVLFSGYKLNPAFLDALVLDVQSVRGKRLRQTSALNMILRLLRFLPSAWKEKWLHDLSDLIASQPANLSTILACKEWQASLFHLISDTLEEFLGDGENKEGTLTNSTSKEGDKLTGGALTDTNSDSDGLEIKGGRSGELRESEFLQTPLSQDPTRIRARFNLALKLYGLLLGHCFRQGGDKGLYSLEQLASLERVCVNGNQVLCLVLNHLLADLVGHGTIELPSVPPTAGRDSAWQLKESAKLVTVGILAATTGKTLTSATAVKHWYCLRHLAAIVASVVTKSGFGMGDLFDSGSLPKPGVDAVSGGLFGIRLSETTVKGMTATAYEQATAVAVTEGDKENHELFRQVCSMLGGQTLSLLDAFIFPDSLDASLPASQLHGLALVRSTDNRMGNAHGPILSSLIKLSLVLLCNLEPCSVKFLQCCSRLRCFLHWSLELIRESVALAGYSAAFHDLTAPLDRLVLAVVLQCHRTLVRCSTVLKQIESEQTLSCFADEDSRQKNHRRLLRVTLELREIVMTAYRGRNEVLRAALSKKAFQSLQAALETAAPNDSDGKRRSKSKENLVRFFLETPWVKGFHDTDDDGNVASPVQQLRKGQRLFWTASSQRGSLAIQELSADSKAIIQEFHRALDPAFDAYCEDQRKWTETHAVRDLEFEGDSIVKRLAAKSRSECVELSRQMAVRANSAIGRWKAVERNVVDLWTTAHAHWKFARHTDRESRRILLVRNRAFNDHADASYELMLGREMEKAMKEQEERKQRKMQEELAAVLKKNEAFITHSGHDDEDAEEDMDDVDEAEEEEEEEEKGGPELAEALQTTSSSFYDNVEVQRRLVGTYGENKLLEGEENDEDDPEYEKVEDIDAWARVFIWSDTESIVARFDDVNIVTLRTITEGRLLLTTHGLYFNQTGDIINVMTKERGFSSESDSLFEQRDLRWRLSRLSEVHGRRFMLRAQAIELFFSDSYELFLNFTGGTRERDRFYAKLRNSCKVPLLWSPKSLNPRVVFKKSKLTAMWRKGKISNFQYLMQLNKMAGRTFNDITQYPVLPWVLSDYSSDTIDLTDPAVYRDLSKPVGALNSDRLEALLERYHELMSFGFSEKEKFLYGSHYSSPGVVLHYLLRQEPFTSMAIELQSGRFDCPDRLFFDIASCWKSCLTSTSDVKELIPELFTCPEVLLNTNNFPLGRTQDKRSISNVGLPPWAKGSAYEFIRIQRLAIESEYVSQNLHHWIDLIFGYKQRGQEAELAHNVFHYLSYEGTIDIDKITDDVERQAAESHIQNFGQTPSQLLVKDSHPPRFPEDKRWGVLLRNELVPRRLRCHTPPKQFGDKRAKGAVLSIHITSDNLFAIYGDRSVGTYRFTPTRGSRPFAFKLDKHRQLARSSLSTSRSALKRGSAAPPSMEIGRSHLAVGGWSTSFTLGGFAKENLRRKTGGSRLSSFTETLREAEASGVFVSCGYWDDAVKVHSVDGSKLLCSSSGGHRGPIRCLSVGADGALMVTGGQDATCRVWVVHHADMAVALSDGYVQTALGESNDGEQRLTCCHVLWGHTSAVTCVDLSSDLDVVVSGSLDGLICVHSIRRGKFVRSFRPMKPGHRINRYPPGVRKIVLDNGGIVIAHMEDDALHTCTVNGVHLCSVDAQERLNDMRITSDGEFLITGGEKGQVMVRTTRDLRVCSVLDLAMHGPVRCITLTPEDLNPIPQFLFIGSDDGMITIVDEDRVQYSRKPSADSVSDQSR